MSENNRMKYRILIIWGDVEPELHPDTDNSYEELLARAKRIRKMEGDGHGLYYVQWEPLVHESLAIYSFGGSELEEKEAE